MPVHRAPGSEHTEYQGRSRRRTRRGRRRIPPKAIFRMSMLLVLLTGCGFGITHLCQSLSQPDAPVVVAQAADGEVEGESATLPVSIPDLDVMPCYSEEAYVVSYLDVAPGVSVHPLLQELYSAQAAASITTAEGEPIVVAPVTTNSGGSGVDNIASWKAQNSDVIGWLKVPGTNINYPVVQGPTTDYYTAKGYDKNYSKQGVIWVDSNCSVSGSLSPNTVIYGHNWTNYSANPRIGSPSDTHFAQLTAFQHLSFAQSHPYLYFSTEGNEMVWQIFAAFYTDIDFNYISSAGGQWIIDGAKARSEHIYDVPVSGSDKIITLSTCTRRFGSSNRQRFVVMAKLVDSADTSVSITANPNPVRPNL